MSRPKSIGRSATGAVLGSAATAAPPTTTQPTAQLAANSAASSGRWTTGRRWSEFRQRQRVGTRGMANLGETNRREPKTRTDRGGRFPHSRPSRSQRQSAAATIAGSWIALSDAKRMLDRNRAVSSAPGRPAEERAVSPRKCLARADREYDFFPAHFPGHFPGQPGLPTVADCRLLGPLGRGGFPALAQAPAKGGKKMAAPDPNSVDASVLKGLQGLAERNTGKAREAVAEGMSRAGRDGNIIMVVSKLELMTDGIERFWRTSTPVWQSCNPAMNSI